MDWTGLHLVLSDLMPVPILQSRLSLVVCLSALACLAQSSAGQPAAVDSTANDHSQVARDYDSVVRFLLHSKSEKRCSPRLVLTILPSFHAQEGININCINSKNVRIKYRTVREPVRTVIRRCFGNAESVTAESLQKCAAVSEKVIDVDQKTIRVWIGEMFKGIEVSSKIFAEDKAQTRPDGAVTIQLDGTRYQLQYHDDLTDLDITVADVEVDGGAQKADTEIATWILQTRGRIQQLLLRQ